LSAHRCVRSSFSPEGVRPPVRVEDCHVELDAVGRGQHPRGSGSRRSTGPPFDRRSGTSALARCAIRPEARRPSWEPCQAAVVGESVRDLEEVGAVHVDRPQVALVGVACARENRSWLLSGDHVGWRASNPSPEEVSCRTSEPSGRIRNNSCRPTVSAGRLGEAAISPVSCPCQFGLAGPWLRTLGRPSRRPASTSRVG
jgi:hypothetical protein